MTTRYETPVLPACVGHERELLAQAQWDISKIHQAVALGLKAIHFTGTRQKIFRAMVAVSARGESSKAALEEQLKHDDCLQEVLPELAACIDYLGASELSFLVKTIVEVAALQLARRQDEHRCNLIDDGEIDSFQDYRERCDADQARLAEYENSTGAAPFFVHADQLHTLQPAEIIPGTHYVRNGLNVTYGPSGSYKTFYTLNKCIEVAQREVVLYQAGEGASGFGARVSAYCAHQRIGPGSLYFCFEPVNLLDVGSVELFITQARKIVEPIAMVVFDTLARALVGADENSSRDVGIGIANANRIQKALGCAIEILHHSNKAERGERGSGALRGAADAMLEMTNDDGLVTVACSKLKDGPAFPTEYYRFVANGDSGLLLPAHDVTVEYTKVSPQQMKVLSALALEIFIDPGAKYSQLIELTKVPDSSLYKVLSTLKQAGFVSQGAKGNPYKLTPTGREMWQRETGALSKIDDQDKPRAANDMPEQLSDPQRTLSELSESDSLYSPHSHTPLGVRVESRSESGTEREVKQQASSHSKTPMGKVLL